MTAKSIPLSTERGKRRPSDSDEGVFFSPESSEMDRRRRRIEQEGHRRWGSIHVNENEYVIGNDAEFGLTDVLPQQDPLMEHLLSQFQQYDGAWGDLDKNPTKDQLIELENEQRKQEYEKQLRLEHQLGLSMSNKYTPKLVR